MTYVSRPTVAWILFAVVTVVAIAVTVSSLAGVASGNTLGIKGIGFLGLLWLLSVGFLVFSIALTIGRARYVAATTLAQREQHKRESRTRGMAKPVDYGQRTDNNDAP